MSMRTCPVQGQLLESVNVMDDQTLLLNSNDSLATYLKQSGSFARRAAIESAWRRVAVRTAAAVIIIQAAFVHAADWKAGTAKRVITTAEAMWMSGYGNRDHPSERTLHDLWCKSLAIEDPSIHRVVLVTLDLCGISKSVSDTVCQRISQQVGIARDSIMICC